MKVKVIGKSFVPGKEGKCSYTICHCAYNNPRIEGTACEVIWVPDTILPSSSITLDSVYIVDRDSKGYLLDFSSKS